MKPSIAALTAILCWIFLAASAPAEVRAPISPMSESLQATMLRNPIRIVKGEHQDISPLFAWIRAPLGSSMSRPCNDWFGMYGTVTQVTKEGLLVRAYEDRWTGASQVIFLRNHPAIDRAVDGSSIAALVTKTGRYQYTTTPGATATVEEYDYGALPTAEETAEYKRRNDERLVNLRKQLAEVQQQIRDDEAAKRAAQIPKIIAYQHQQASNGYPSFQLELGKRYLNGDGVPADKMLAIHWLKSACTNGLSEATNLLLKIR